jgi:hypothetical protein
LAWRHERWQARQHAETEWMTLSKARQAISEMKSTAFYDLVALEEIEGFISHLENTLEEGEI